MCESNYNVVEIYAAPIWNQAGIISDIALNVPRLLLDNPYMQV